MNGQAGKGDTYRPVNRKKWDEGWARAFGVKNEEVDNLDVRDADNMVNRVRGSEGTNKEKPRSVSGGS